MEKRITKKCEEHVSQFKDEIKNWLEDNNIEMKGKQDTSHFLQFVYDFGSIKITKEDFAKRKRIKNVVPSTDRCCACRANGEQCTRRKQDGLNFCGTHNKGTPHGTIETFLDTYEPISCKVEVTIKEIKGIWYYIDEKKNIYKTEDVLSNKINPKIIGTYLEDNNNLKVELF